MLELLELTRGWGFFGLVAISGEFPWVGTPNLSGHSQARRSLGDVGTWISLYDMAIMKTRALGS